MTESRSREVTELATSVVFATLPEVRQNVYYGWRFLLIVAAFAFTFASLAYWMPIPSGILAGAMIVYGTLMFVIYRGRAVALRNKNAKRRTGGGKGGPSTTSGTCDARAIGELIFDLELARPLLPLVHEGIWPWKRFEEQRIRRGISAPTAVVETCLQPTISRIERTPELLEPETISSSAAWSRKTLVALVGFWILLAVLGLVNRDWILAGLGLSFVAVVLARVPIVRRFVPMLRAEAHAPVAGPGYIEDARGKRWTVGTAIMLVFAKSPAGPLIVRLVGDAGWQTLTFMHPDDPDFIGLWQRWTHPNPRLELLDPES